MFKRRLGNTYEIGIAFFCEQEPYHTKWERSLNVAGLIDIQQPRNIYVSIVLLSTDATRMNLYEHVVLAYKPPTSKSAV